jgi:Pretoxin HINT domain
VGARVGGAVGGKIGNAAVGAVRGKFVPGGMPSAPSPSKPSCTGSTCTNGNCFVAGTLVATPSGPVAIEEIRAGDLVESRDGKTGETAYRTVEEAFVRHVSALADIEIERADGATETLSTTLEHPFWVSDLGWRLAGDIEVGMALVADDGASVHVASVREPPTLRCTILRSRDFTRTSLVKNGFGYIMRVRITAARESHGTLKSRTICGRTHWMLRRAPTARNLVQRRQSRIKLVDERSRSSKGLSIPNRIPTPSTRNRTSTTRTNRQRSRVENLTAITPFRGSLPNGNVLRMASIPIVSPHVETVIRLFVAKARQERLVTLAGTKGRRTDFVNDALHDRRRLASEVLIPLTHPAFNWESALREMRLRGATSLAYCIADDVDFDDTERPLEFALRTFVGRARDALVFAIGSTVAYYENHEGEQYLIYRNLR